MSACRHGYRECATCLDEARALLADALAFVECKVPPNCDCDDCKAMRDDYNARRAALITRLEGATK